MTQVPIEHKEENFKLEAKPYVDLFQIWLRSGGRLYIKANHNVTWQGNTYEGTGVKIEGVGNYADEKTSRPQFSVVNPRGIFSPIIRDGDLNRAQVHRFRVLKNHIESDTNVYQVQSWMVTRIVLLTEEAILTELRDSTDGVNFITPARMFIPPEFPLVSLR